MTKNVFCVQSSTIDVILKLLDKSYGDIWLTKEGPNRDSQIAYYNGQKTTFEMLITDIYKNDLSIRTDLNGKHYIARKDGSDSYEFGNAV